MRSSEGSSNRPKKTVVKPGVSKKHHLPRTLAVARRGGVHCDAVHVNGPYPVFVLTMVDVGPKVALCPPMSAPTVRRDCSVPRCPSLRSDGRIVDARPANGRKAEVIGHRSGQRVRMTQKAP